MIGKCRICGQDKSGGSLFVLWVKPTFMDWDKLLPGDIICNDCLFWFNEASQELAARIGKEKPQRMRNYSHFIINGEWIPLSKGDKARMAELLLSEPFPELAVMAESGQKHIVFRANRNLQGSRAGWVQFEEQSLWVEPDKLRALLDVIRSLLIIFSKAEIETAQYKPYRIINFGLEQWRILERELKPSRGSLLFNLALFLAQKEDTNAGESSGLTGNHLEGDRQGIQEPVSPDNLETIRGHSTGKRTHEQSGEVHQLSLPET